MQQRFLYKKKKKTEREKPRLNRVQIASETNFGSRTIFSEFPTKKVFKLLESVKCCFELSRNTKIKRYIYMLMPYGYAIC